jgi:hypothetical protein
MDNIINECIGEPNIHPLSWWLRKGLHAAQNCDSHPNHLLERLKYRSKIVHHKRF